MSDAVYKPSADVSQTAYIKSMEEYQQMYERITSRKPPHKGHFVALVAIARDFIANVLYDMWRNQRPFFDKVEDYRAYRQTHPRSKD